jgi:hypothetical protein
MGKQFDIPGQATMYFARTSGNNALSAQRRQYRYQTIRLTCIGSPDDDRFGTVDTIPQCRDSPSQQRRNGDRQRQRIIIDLAPGAGQS